MGIGQDKHAVTLKAAYIAILLLAVQYSPHCL